jgi:hypothetical protein
MSSSRLRGSSETRESRARAPWRRRLGRVGGVLVLALTLASASATTTWAHEHDPEESGHPVRVLAYLLHPVGVIIDYVLFRPAHWVVSHEPFQTLFGHEPEE